jgi:hypothetical protein
MATFLAAPPVTGAAGPWKELFALPKSDSGNSFIAVWGDDAGVVVAVGFGVIVQGKVGGAFATTELPPRHALFDVWGKSADDLFAVGPRQLIMHFAERKWITERPQQEGNPRQLLLFEVGPFPPGTIAAYGPGMGEDGFKRVAGNWVPLTRSEIAAIRKREAIDEPQNKYCRSAVQQRSVTQEGTGWVVCDDRSAFVQSGQAFERRGRAPVRCNRGVPIHGSAIWKGDLVLNCDGELWRNHGAQWERDPTPAKVEAIYSTSACLYAVTRRTILARCER